MYAVRLSAFHNSTHAYHKPIFADLNSALSFLHSFDHLCRYDASITDGKQTLYVYHDGGIWDTFPEATFTDPGSVDSYFISTLSA